MKWFGNIAFSNQVETELHVFKERVVLRQFMGDVVRASKSNDANSDINVNISVSNQLSVVMDPFLQNNFHKILYVDFNGAKWTVSSVEIRDRRLLLSFGKLYNEEEEQ